MGAAPRPAPLPSPLPANLRGAAAPAAAAPRVAASDVTIAVMILIWLAWLGVIVVADFLAFLMFAFADSPGAGRAAQAMIIPAFVWFGFTFVAGAVLLIVRRWWTIALAFVLAVSPPFLIFAGYNVLAGAGGGSGGTMTPSAAAPSTAPAVHTPPGGFKPAPMTPRDPLEFHEAVRAAKAAATTQP